MTINKDIPRIVIYSDSQVVVNAIKGKIAIPKGNYQFGGEY